MGRALTSDLVCEASTCLEALRTLVEGQPQQERPLEAFVSSVTARLVGFESWMNNAIAKTKTDNGICLLKGFEGRWRKIIDLLGCLTELEGRRMKLESDLMALGRGEDVDSTGSAFERALAFAEWSEKSLATRLRAEPALATEVLEMRSAAISNVETKELLMRMEQNVVIQDLVETTRRVFKPKNDLVKAAQRLLKQKQVQELKHQPGNWRREKLLELELLEAELLGDEEKASKVAKDLREHQYLIKLFWNWLSLLHWADRCRQQLSGAYCAGQFLEKGSETLEWWSKIKTIVGTRPCFIAGSLHADEANVVVDAFSKARIRAKCDDSLLLVVPRNDFAHVSRDAEIAGKRAGLRTMKVSALEEYATDVDVAIYDEGGPFGLLADLYSLGRAAIVGGAICDDEDHNVCEPLSWGIPVSVGNNYGSCSPDRRRIRTLFNKKLRALEGELIDFLDPEQIEDLVAQWAGLMDSPLPNSRIIQRCDSLISFAEEIEVEVFEGLNFLEPERFEWLKKKGDGDFPPETPSVEYFTELRLDLLAGWTSRLTARYERWLAGDIDGLKAG